MPRAERIQYQDPYYHVINRGRERGCILFVSTPR